MDTRIKREDLVEGLKLMEKKGNCLDYAGQAKDINDVDVAMFELFQTGHIIFAPWDSVEELMAEQEMVIITPLDWKKRIVSLVKYQASQEKYASYLEVYEALELSDDEIIAEYKKLDPE